ncbi:MAG: Gfo/Idh/MocA family oxidoreductase [Acidobacteria bacterium]|nr:Gfo/Idh/MocA family oxidoreductase [Acidobacteriota bacterium]
MKKVRWVLAGVGDIATKRVLPAIQSEPRSELVGVVSRDGEKGRRWAPRVWGTVDEALQWGEFDALYVATPVALHAPQSMAALRAGKHVLCEKPTAMNAAEAREMARVAEECGRLLGVAYYRRLYPAVLRARELMRAGAIGKPVLAELRLHGWFDPVDGFRGWLVDPKLAGGGPLYDVGSHRIDLLHFWFGKPERAVGLKGRAVHEREVEDSATVLVEYAGGVRGVVDVRWHSRVERDECSIVGTDGAIEMTPLNSGRVAWPGGEEMLPPHANLHYPAVENFVGAVLAAGGLSAGKPGAELMCPAAEAAWTDWVTGQVAAR